MSRSGLLKVLRSAAGVILAAFFAPAWASYSGGPIHVVGSSLSAYGYCVVGTDYPDIATYQAACSWSPVNVGCSGHTGKWVYPGVVEDNGVNTLTIYQDIKWTTTSPPASGTCPHNQVAVATYQPPQNTCAVAAGRSLGFMKTSDRDADGYPLSNYGCVNNCEASAGVAYDVVVPGQPTGYSYYWVSSGNACPSNSSPKFSDQVGCVDTEVVHLGGASITTCADNGAVGNVYDGPYVNPTTEQIEYSGTSWDTALNQNGGCIQTAKGGMFCITSAPTDSRPKDPVGGAVKPPDLQVTQHKPFGGSSSSDTQWDYYASSTVSSTCGGVGQAACGGGGTAGGDTGSCDPATEDCSKCGAPGQPTCRVKIDESGTQTTVPEFTQKSDYDALTTAVDDAANHPPQGLETFGNDMLALITGVQSSSCQSLTFNFALPIVGTKTIVFPGDEGCQKIEWIKSVEAWLLWLTTAIAIIFMALKESKPS